MDFILEYIKGKKYIVSDALSIFPFNGNQDSSQNSTYQKEIVPEINDIEEIPEGTFPINLKLFKKYQWSEPILMAKYQDGTCHKGYFYGESNIDINLIKCKDQIFIPSKF